MASIALNLAALILFGCGVVHSILGERLLIGPLLHPEKRRGILAHSPLARQTLRFAWHVTSIIWWGVAAIFVVLSLSPINSQDRAILIVVAITFFIIGLVALIASKGRHYSWIAFFIITGLVLVPLF